MNCRSKGCRLDDKKSKKYKCLKVIEKEYGCLAKFLEAIEFKEVA